MQIIDTLYAFFWKSMSRNNCNTYLINGPARILIDPGHREPFDHVENELKRIGLNRKSVDLIICSHAHPDHIEAVQLFRETPAQITIHEKEWFFLKSVDRYVSASFGTGTDAITPDFFLAEGDISIHGIDLKVFHTPGHSPGSITLYWPEQKALFTGDLIFNRGLGRTDLPGGNGSELKESIRRLKDLDVEWLLPGHGDMVQGAENVKANFESVEREWFGYI